MENDNSPLPPEPGNWHDIKLLLQKIYAVLKKQRSQDVDYYDNADLKQMLKISDSTLQRLRKSKTLPFIKIRGKIYYPKPYFNNAFKL